MGSPPTFTDFKGTSSTLSILKFFDPNTKNGEDSYSTLVHKFISPTFLLQDTLNAQHNDGYFVIKGIEANYNSNYHYNMYLLLTGLSKAEMIRLRKNEKKYMCCYQTLNPFQTDNANYFNYG